MEAIYTKISNQLSGVELEVFKSPSYQQWLKDLIELKTDHPEQFKKVFSFREHSYLQDTIVEAVLNDATT